MKCQKYTIIPVLLLAPIAVVQAKDKRSVEEFGIDVESIVLDESQVKR